MSTITNPYDRRFLARTVALVFVLLGNALTAATLVLTAAGVLR